MLHQPCQSKPDDLQATIILPPCLYLLWPQAGRKISLKPFIPSDFDGDHTKGKAFLTSCWTYIHLCSEDFDDDITKIIWVTSYMKSRCVGCWATQELEYEATSKDERLCFTNWIDFEDKNLCPSTQRPQLWTCWTSRLLTSGKALFALDVFGCLWDGLAIDKNLRKWWQIIKICFKAYLRKVGDYIMLISLYGIY